MTAQFRILFSGVILEGFEVDKVKVAAGDKLKASPAQVDRLFSGKRAVLKKNLEEDKAQQYLRVLKRIGMDVRLEKEEQELELAPIQLELMQEPEPKTASTPPLENYDPERTLLSNPALAAGLLDRSTPSNERASLDDLPSLESELQLMDEASTSHEATMLVSPQQAQESFQPHTMASSSANDVTMIVSRDDIDRLREHQKAEAASAASEATLIVSPSDAARFIALQKDTASNASDEVTMIVSPGSMAHVMPAKQSTASSSHEETLIVSPSMVKNYVAEQKAVAVPTPLVQQAPKAAPKPQPNAPHSSSSNAVLHFGIFLALLVTAVAVYLFW